VARIRNNLEQHPINVTDSNLENLSPFCRTQSHLPSHRRYRRTPGSAAADYAGKCSNGARDAVRTTFLVPSPAFACPWADTKHFLVGVADVRHPKMMTMKDDYHPLHGHVSATAGECVEQRSHPALITEAAIPCFFWLGSARVDWCDSFRS
jgi:hypothetical protein